MQLRSRFNGIEQYEFTKLANIYHAQDLAIRAYRKSKTFTKSTQAMRTIDKLHTINRKTTLEADEEVNSLVNLHAA